MTNRIDPALRAAACERLKAVAEAEELPTIDGEPSFAARLRQLYEQSALPVHEIARIAGIAQRTLFSYVQRGGWKRRNWRQARHDAARRAPPEGADLAAAAEEARHTAHAYVAARELVNEASAAAAAAARERAAHAEAVAQQRAARAKAVADARARARLAAAVADALRILAQVERSGRPLSKRGRRVRDRIFDTLVGQFEHLQG
jgi:colicin import membrane protein